jgi:hypothetical protein
MAEGHHGAGTGLAVEMYSATCHPERRTQCTATASTSCRQHLIGNRLRAYPRPLHLAWLRA